MNIPAPLNDIAHIIQLAVAPVFLIAGIGSFLNVLTSRLARVIDRARNLETSLHDMAAKERDRSLNELVTLDRRMAVVQWAISLCTASAAAVCVLVTVLFVADMMQLNFAQPVAILFILTMVLLTFGLLLFLVEVYLATKAIRVRRDLLPGQRQSDFKRQSKH